MEFSRKDALLRHKRNRHGTTQSYPHSSDAYPPSSQAYPPPPPQVLFYNNTHSPCFCVGQHLVGNLVG